MYEIMGVNWKQNIRICSRITFLPFEHEYSLFQSFGYQIKIELLGKKIKFAVFILIYNNLFIIRSLYIIHHPIAIPTTKIFQCNVKYQSCDSGACWVQKIFETVCMYITIANGNHGDLNFLKVKCQETAKRLYCSMMF